MPTDELLLRPATADDLPGDRRAAHPGPRRGVPRDAARHPPRPRGPGLGGGLGPVEVRRLGGRARRRRWSATPGSTATWLDDLYVEPGRPGQRRRLRAARPGQGPAAGRVLPVGLRVQRAGPRASTAPAAWSTSSAPTARPTRRRPPTSGWPGPAATRSPSTARLIDAVDADLGDLLNRRAALTAAVQPHKGTTERDLDREREIARALALRAPALGEERLTRIVHADHHREPGRRGACSEPDVGSRTSRLSAVPATIATVAVVG